MRDHACAKNASPVHLRSYDTKCYFVSRVHLRSYSATAIERDKKCSYSHAFGFPNLSVVFNGIPLKLPVLLATIFLQVNNILNNAIH